MVFDIGDVLIDLDYDECERAFTALGCDYSKMRAALEPMVPAWMRGQMNAKHIYQTLRSHFPDGLSFDGFKNAFCRQLGKPKKEGLKVLEGIPQELSRACLSDTVDAHWNFITASYPFLEKFSPCLASHLLGVCKFDLGGFVRVANTLHASPEQIVLIDDRLINIENARKEGWHGVLFTDGDSCISSLRELGVTMSSVKA